MHRYLFGREGVREASIGLEKEQDSFFCFGYCRKKGFIIISIY